MPDENLAEAAVFSSENFLKEVFPTRFFVRKLLERSFPTPFKNFPERIFIV